ncbi:hypothetical protein RB653_007633 [Dictyostelium firmibasis]|uniref:Follistatin-like domain-containing protein n=1 Tax=Dictyostelium firmibasis TaxID=79012 RepID=A0AAN7TNX5_9MYCE
MKKGITFLVLLAAAQIYAQDCSSLTENECHRNSSCIPVNYKKCCGEQEFGCFDGDYSNCKYITKCYKSSKSFDVIEATNACFIPPPGYEVFEPVSSCTNDEHKLCSDQGKQCIFKRNDCPNPTSCCPGHGICEDNNGGTTTTSTTTTSTSGAETTATITPQTRGFPTTGGTGSVPIDACTNVVCQQGEHCEVDQEGRGHCFVNIESIGSLPLGCLNVVCQPNQHCELDKDTGKAHCVLNINPIGFTTIGASSTVAGSSSTTSGGSGSNDICPNVHCPDNFHCEMRQDGKAQCVANINAIGFTTASTNGLIPPSIGSTFGWSDVCSNVICPPGFYCKKNDQTGKADCLSSSSTTNGGIGIVPL